jgi:hypothetical protein
MKYILGLFFSLVLFAGCGDKEPEQAAKEENKFAFDTTDIKTEPVENPGEQFQMIYKFDQNTPYNYRITMISDVNQQTTMDTVIDMNMHQYMVYLLQLTAKETDSDGNTELNCNITSAKVEMEGNGRKVTYESDSIDTPEEKADFAEHHSLVNNPFTIRISKNGEILEFFRVDKLVNSYLEYKNLKDSATAEDKSALRGQFTESMLQPLLTQVFRKVPADSVAKDSVWTFKQPTRQMLIFKVDQTSKFKVNQLEKFEDDKLAVIGVELETNVTGDTKVTEQGVNYNFQKPRISAAGTIYFNIDQGYVQKVKTETLFETFVTAESGGMKRSNKETVKNTNYVEKL